MIGTTPKITKEPNPPFLINDAVLELEAPNKAIINPTTRIIEEVNK